MENKVRISLLILSLAIVGVFALTIQMTVNATTSGKQTNTVENLIENLAGNAIEMNNVTNTLK